MLRLPVNRQLSCPLALVLVEHDSSVARCVVFMHFPMCVHVQPAARCPKVFNSIIYNVTIYMVNHKGPFSSVPEIDGPMNTYKVFSMHHA